MEMVILMKKVNIFKDFTNILINKLLSHCKYFEGVRTFWKRFAAYIPSIEGIETQVSKTLSKGFLKIS